MWFIFVMLYFVSPVFYGLNCVKSPFHFPLPSKWKPSRSQDTSIDMPKHIFDIQQIWNCKVIKFFSSRQPFLHDSIELKDPPNEQKKPIKR